MKYNKKSCKTRHPRPTPPPHHNMLTLHHMDSHAFRPHSENPNVKFAFLPPTRFITYDKTFSAALTNPLKPFRIAFMFYRTMINFLSPRAIIAFDNNRDNNNNKNNSTPLLPPYPLSCSLPPPPHPLQLARPKPIS